MAEIFPTTTNKPYHGTVHTWTGVTESDTFAPVQLSANDAPVSVQVWGTFGGATVKLTASHDGTNYADLYNTTGAPISITSAAIHGVLQSPLIHIKPSHSGGSSESITVAVFEGVSR